MEILEFCVQKLRNKQVDKFELYYEKSSSLGVEIHDGKLDHLSRATDQGLAIRTLKNQRMGFSYTFDLSPKAVELAVSTALEIGELMPADPLNELRKIGSGSGFSEQFDQDGLEVSLDEKIEMARALEANAKRHDGRIKRVRKAGFDEIWGETVIVDSTGKKQSYRQTLFGIDLTCVAEDGNDAEMGYDSRYTSKFNELNPDSVSLEAAHSALELLHAGQSPTMTCPVVLKNSVVAQLVGFLASSFSAENIDKNFSLLIGKKGERLFSPKLTLIDDALLAGGTASAPFDGEGQPSQVTTLVDQGVIANYLYDGYYARKHKTRSTSNSRRGGLKSPPGVGPSNIYLSKGTKPLEKLFAEAGKGIYITDVMGLHTANPVTGEFSVGASGILIENGALTKPVKGFALSGNLIELLKNSSEVGSNLRFWGSVGAPSLMVSSLSVSGS